MIPTPLQGIRLSPRTIFFCILLGVIISYSNTLYSPFVLDDFHSFINEPNSYVAGLSPETFTRLASTRFGIKRLLPLATFALDHNLALRLNSGITQYHFTNILIHLLATIAVTLFVQSLLMHAKKTALTSLSPSHAGLMVGALWALNPLQTNAVTYLVQRMTSLATLFYITALLFYVTARSADTSIKKCLAYSACLTTACCAFLSKEISFTLPFTVLLVEAMFLSPPGAILLFMKRLQWKLFLPLFLILLILLPLAENYLASQLAVFANRDFTIWERLLTESRVLVFYLSLLVLPLPSRMNLEHDFPISQSILSPITTIGSITLLAGILFTAILYRKKAPLISFGIFWFFLNLLIESTIIPLELIFEHRLYLPSVGFFLSVLGVADLLLKRCTDIYSSAKWKQLPVLTVIILASWSSVLTTLRNDDWRDQYTLYIDCARKSPNKPRALTNAGLAAAMQSDYSEALNYFNKSLRFSQFGREEYFTTANNIICCFIAQKNFKAAINQGEKLLKGIPFEALNLLSLPSFLANLAIAYREEKQFAKAYEVNISALLTENSLPQYSPSIRAKVFTELTRLLSSAYNNENLRNELHLADSNDKTTAVRIELSRIAVSLRDYDRAEFFITPASIPEPNNANVAALQEIIMIVKEKNRRQHELSDIKSHRLYKESLPYRFLLDSYLFIDHYYRPLRFTRDWILAQAESIAQSVDHFVVLYKSQRLAQDNKTDLALAEIKKALKHFPDCTLLLNEAARCNRMRGDGQKAARLYQRILEIYPDVSGWQMMKRFISANKTTYKSSAHD